MRSRFAHLSKAKPTMTERQMISARPLLELPKALTYNLLLSRHHQLSLLQFLAWPEQSQVESAGLPRLPPRFRPTKEKLPAAFLHQASSEAAQNGMPQWPQAVRASAQQTMPQQFGSSFRRSRLSRRHLHRIQPLHPLLQPRHLGRRQKPTLSHQIQTSKMEAVV